MSRNSGGAQSLLKMLLVSALILRPAGWKIGELETKMVLMTGTTSQTGALARSQCSRTTTTSERRACSRNLLALYPLTHPLFHPLSDLLRTSLNQIFHLSSFDVVSLVSTTQMSSCLKHNIVLYDRLHIHVYCLQAGIHKSPWGALPRPMPDDRKPHDAGGTKTDPNDL